MFRCLSACIGCIYFSVSCRTNLVSSIQFPQEMGIRTVIRTNVIFLEASQYINVRLMGLLVGCWLVVELGVVPGTMGPGCCSQPISGSLGSTPRAGRADPLLGNSLGRSS